MENDFPMIIVESYFDGLSNVDPKLSFAELAEVL